MPTDRPLLAAVFLGVGIALAGLFAGNGFARARSSDRFVTVKGISERPAKADLAIWPLQVVSADDDLARANAKLQTSISRIQEFLARQQIDTTQSELQNFSVSDALTNQYGPGERAPARYVIHQTLMVRSTRPDLILAASRRIAELVSAGVVLSSGGESGSGPTFVFTGLNALKPPMIAEATARAGIRRTVCPRLPQRPGRNPTSEPGHLRDPAA